MKVLTVRQPWAWAIARGHKPIENRGWTIDYRGPLAIHAASQWDEDGVLATRFVGETIRAQGGKHPKRLQDDLPYSAARLVVAVVQLTGMCTRSLTSPTLLCECGPWAQPMSVHWHLDNARRLPEPFEAKGRLGLWDCEVPNE